MEDFGYQKDSQSRLLEVGKKTFLIAATIFSIACFIYITINAYYFVYKDQKQEVELIKGPEGEIKISKEEKIAKKEAGLQINRSIYEDIFGNQKATKTKIKDAPIPAIPPKELATTDRRLIKTSQTQQKSPEKKSQGRNKPIVVYSDNKDAKKSTTDLLTKTDGKRHVTPVKRSQKRAVRVQVAAMSSKQAAKDGWQKLTRLYPKLFSGLSPAIQEVNLGKRGVFYRLQIGSFYNQLEAEEFCKRYTAQAGKSRADCIVVE